MAASLECIKMRLLLLSSLVPRLELPSDSRPLTFVIIVVVVIIEDEVVEKKNKLPP